MAFEIIRYNDAYKNDFARLNFAWIEKYFVVEEADRKYLLFPREMIIEPGGEIFFLLEDEKIKGTCALLKFDGDTFELVKMAVEPESQGRGFASHLLRAAIDWACAQNAKRIFLESNTVLAPALKLYEKFGFRKKESNFENSEYARVNIVMELNMDSAVLES